MDSTVALEGGLPSDQADGFNGTNGGSAAMAKSPMTQDSKPSVYAQPSSKDVLIDIVFERSTPGTGPHATMQKINDEEMGCGCMTVKQRALRDQAFHKALMDIEKPSFCRDSRILMGLVHFHRDPIALHATC